MVRNASMEIGVLHASETKSLELFEKYFEELLSPSID